jgi:hypothetical protein
VQAVKEMNQGPVELQMQCHDNLGSSKGLGGYVERIRLGLRDVALGVR